MPELTLDQKERLKVALQSLQAAFTESDLEARLESLEQWPDQLLQGIEGTVDDVQTECEELLSRAESIPDELQEKIAERAEAGMENIASEFESLLENLPEEFTDTLKEHFEEGVNTWLNEKSDIAEALGKDCEQTVLDVAASAEHTINQCFDAAVDDIRRSVEDGAKEAFRAFEDRAVVAAQKELVETAVLANANIAISQAISSYAPQIRAAKELAEQINEVM